MTVLLTEPRCQVPPPSSVKTPGVWERAPVRVSMPAFWNSSGLMMETDTPDRLYGTPVKWDAMVNSGMTCMVSELAEGLESSFLADSAREDWPANAARPTAIAPI